MGAGPFGTTTVFFAAPLHQRSCAHSPVAHLVTDPRGPAALAEVCRLAFRLGATAFGCPAAHIAMLRDEVVVRRGWMSEAQFLDLLGATNLIPGPNSTEMVMHTGMDRAGWRGLLGAGTLFILPAAAITLAFAWAYGEYGSTPAAEWLLYGVKPVVIAVVVQAIWGLGRQALAAPATIAVGLAVFAMALLGVSELALLLGAGVLLALVGLLRVRGAGSGNGGPGLLLTPWLGQAPRLDAGWPSFLALAATPLPYDPATLFWTFLKIGGTLYGSGYVLLAFLQQDFVDRLGWIGQQQLLDAVAVGQFTPGPVFTTATFVGYLVGGWTGALLATLAIFLPAFVFVALTHRLVPRIRTSPISAGFLDGVNAAAVALMAVVALTLGRSAVIDVPTALLAAVAAVLLVRFKLNSAWLILAGAATGFAFRGLPNLLS